VGGVRQWRAGLAAAALIGAAAAPIAVVVSARPGDPRLFPARPASAAVPVFVVHNGYHAELALPAALWRNRGGPFALAMQDLEPTPWVLVGWGDARFYRGRGWSWGRLAEAADATLPPDNAAVLRLTPLAGPPTSASETDLLRLWLSPAGARALTARLDRAFVVSNHRPVVVAPAPHAPTARFHASRERFGLPRFCNNWTGDLLAAAGLPTTPAVHLAPQGLMLDLRLRALRPAGGNEPAPSGVLPVRHLKQRTTEPVARPPFRMGVQSWLSNPRTT
jgi:hypothetical protein